MVTLANVAYIKAVWIVSNTDFFSTLFTNTARSEFAVTRSLKIPPHLRHCAAALPCETESLARAWSNKHELIVR